MFSLGISLEMNQLPRYCSDFLEYTEHITHIQVKHLPELNVRVLKELEGFKQQHKDIEYSIHAQETLNFVDDNATVRLVWFNYAKDLIQFASDSGITFINFHAGYFFQNGSGDERKEYLVRLVDTLERLLALARRENVEIHIENMPYYPLSCPIRFLLDQYSDFHYLMKSIKSEYLKLCYDYGHGNISTDGIEILRQHSFTLGSLHVHSNHGHMDEHDSISEKDAVNWKQEIQYLDSNDFCGPFILECSTTKTLESLRNLQLII